MHRGGRARASYESVGSRHETEPVLANLQVQCRRHLLAILAVPGSNPDVPPTFEELPLLALGPFKLAVRLPVRWLGEQRERVPIVVAVQDHLGAAYRLD